MNTNYLKLSIKDENGNCYYGGDQSWFSSNTRAMAGCSSVAGVNTLRLLCSTRQEAWDAIRESKTVPSPIKNALLHKNVLRDDYLMLMTGMYEVMKAFEIFPLNLIYDRHSRDNKFFKYVKPNTGRSSIGYIIGVLRYAQKSGLYLKYHALPTAFCSKEEASEFIRKGLEESGCVTLLTSYNKHDLKVFHPTMMDRLTTDSSDNAFNECPCGDTYMKCHFAIISDIKTNQVMISTWGKIATANFNDLVKSWHSIKAWESALFYFTPATKKEMRHSLLTAWIPFVKGIVQAIIRKRVH